MVGPVRDHGRMQRVNGIGGFFFVARDPDRLTAWYADMLGVEPPPADYSQPSWRQTAGPTVFAAFPPEASSEHLSGRSWGINFRVDDLDAMVVQLRDAGIDVTVDDETYPNGRFAATTDPEGNHVQLWEPAGADAGRHGD